MKISLLRIENFRGIKSQEIRPDALNVFLGGTGKGKTSILRALGAALTGNMSASDIKKGEKKASVYLQWEDGSSIERIRKKDQTTVKLNGKATSAKSANAYIENMLGASVDVFESICGIDYFEALSKRDLTSFFLTILPATITFEKMIEMIEQMEKVKMPAEKRNLLATEFPDNTPFGLSEIDAAYQSFFEQRKFKKKELAAVSAKANYEGPIPTVKKEDLEKELYDIAKKEAEYASNQKRINEFQAALKRREEALATRKKLQEQLDEQKDVVRPDETILKNAKEDKVKFERAIAKSQKLMGVFSGNVELYKKTLNSLDKPVCPISGKLICTTDKSALKADLEAAVKQNEEGVKEHQNFIVRCEEQIKKRDLAIEKYNADMLLFTKKEGIEKQLREFIVPELPEEPKKIDAADFAARKAEINKALSEINLYESALAEKKKADALQAEYSLLEYAVAILDVKNGVRTKILERVMAPFETICNQKLIAMNNNMQMKFTCTDGIQIQIKTEKSEEFIPLSNCSTGEFVIAAYLLMSIINKVKQTKYAVIDNLDKLDEEHTEQLLRLLLSDLNTEYDHIFVGASNHDDTCDTIRKLSDSNSLIHVVEII